MKPKTMKLFSGLLFGNFFLNIGQIFGWFSTTPHWHLLIAIVVFVVVDFATAMMKLKAMNIEPTSEGYRRSISKFSQYGAAIVVSYALWFLAKTSFAQSGLILNIILCAVIFVEITSIFENIYEVDSRSYFAKYFIFPVLWLMKFSMVKNPVMKQMEKMQESENLKKESEKNP